MKKLHLKHAAVSSAVVYILGICVYVGSFSIPLMDDLELQANLALMLVIMPLAFFAAHLYYKRGHRTNGYVLANVMFCGAMMLDAAITVPVFIMPFGGNHLTFFGDPFFWLIAFQYILAVVSYSFFKVDRTAEAK